MNTLIEQTYSDIVTPELLKNTLDHNVHTGFLEDYRVLSCLLKIHQPKSIFEIGTNIGGGINVMATALPEAKIFSLDLDYETMKLNSKQYPIGKNGEDRVGSAVRFPYTQLRGDSLTFPYQKYPCEAFFVDGEHDYKHAYTETESILFQKPKLIIYHDADMEPVFSGAMTAFKKHEHGTEYVLYRVVDTRILYAVKRK